MTSAVAYLAGCSDKDCSISVIEETTVNCYTCGAPRRLQVGVVILDDLVLLSSNVTFAVTMTALNITELIETMDDNLNATNKNLTDSNSTFTFISPAVHVTTSSPTYAPSTAPSTSPHTPPSSRPSKRSSKSAKSSKESKYTSNPSPSTPNNHPSNTGTPSLSWSSKSNKPSSPSNLIKTNPAPQTTLKPSTIMQVYAKSSKMTKSTNVY